MDYINKGETLIKRMYKSIRESIKNLDKLIEENNLAGYNTSYLRGVKKGKIDLLKDFIREVRELEEE